LRRRRVSYDSENVPEFVEKLFYRIPKYLYFIEGRYVILIPCFLVTMNMMLF
jgi:hypothetical protein